MDVVWGPPRCFWARESTAPAQGNQALSTGEDSEEAVAVRSWFEGGRDFPPPSAQPLKKEKHKLPSEEVPGTVCRLCTEKELGRTSQPTERGDLEVLK